MNIIVTGGAGSIGSEICRQIANYDIKSLIIVDISENNSYEIYNNGFYSIYDIEEIAQKIKIVYFGAG